MMKGKHLAGFTANPCLLRHEHVEYMPSSSTDLFLSELSWQGKKPCSDSMILWIAWSCGTSDWAYPRHVTQILLKEPRNSIYRYLGLIRYATPKHLCQWLKPHSG